MDRPKQSEVPAYYWNFIEALPPGGMLETLEREGRETISLLGSLEPEKWGYRYAEEKWSIAELVGHLGDVERVFALRALWWARADQTDQPGFEQDDWVGVMNQSQIDPSKLIDFLRSGRAATLGLFRSLDEAALGRTGTANGTSLVCGQVAWILAGHERHHRRVLQERYLIPPHKAF